MIIKNFPNYNVSPDGTIYKIANVIGVKLKSGKIYQKTIPPILVSPFDNGTGYLQVNLKNGSTRIKKYVHILVADAYIVKPMNGNNLEIDHIDENKQNNQYTNLRWATRKENMHKMLLSNPHVLDNLLCMQ